MPRPTPDQIIDYVANNPGCTSKEIATKYNCIARDINRSQDGVPGIYAIPEIRSDNYRHFIHDNPDDGDKIESLQSEILVLQEKLAEVLEHQEEIACHVAGLDEKAVRRIKGKMKAAGMKRTPIKQ